MMPPDAPLPAGRASADDSAPSASPPRLPSWPGWLVAAGCAVAAGLLGQRYLETRSALVAAREEAALERVDARSARNSLEAERLISQGQLAELRRAQEQVDAFKRGSDLAGLRVVALASRLEDDPHAAGVVVWSAVKQEGILVASLLAPLPPGKVYRLWIVDPQYPVPVDAGEFVVDPKAGSARHIFKAAQPIDAAEKFVVSLESKGKPAKPEGPAVLAAP